MTRLPECHSRRTIAPDVGRFRCVHPRVHAANGVVTPSVCWSCRLAGAPPPEAVRTPGSTTLRPDLELVVARHREDVGWLDRFRHVTTTVYEKGGGSGPRSLPNVGREADTYLHHVVENYDRLADVTVFLQGHPFDHVHDLDERVWSLERECGFVELGEIPLVEDGTGLPVHPGLPVGRRYAEVLGGAPLEHSVCRAGACFAVDRGTIRRRPRSFYRELRERVVRDPSGPWWVERLWRHVFDRPPRTVGVVTAADAGYFAELAFLVHSLRARSGNELLVFDLGLHPEQREWLAEQPGVRCRALRTRGTCLEEFQRLQLWQSWLKPFLVELAPFDRVLWIDADCVVLGPLDEAFSTIAERPLIVRDDTPEVTGNDPGLYDWFPIPEGAPDEAVNAGVVGLCKRRDHRLLASWVWGVQRMARNPRLQRLSAWWDQGILRWALRFHGLTDVVTDDVRWNRSAREQPELITLAMRNGRSVLDEVSHRFPDVSIVHWLGKFKLSRQLASEFGRLFTHGAAYRGTSPNVLPIATGGTP